MAGRFKTVTIGSETYQLPQAGASPPWGEELSALIEAMIASINTTNGAADITETSAVILNTSGVKDIQGLAFDPVIVRSGEISYSLVRTITKAITDIPTGTGTIQITCSDKHDLFTGDSTTIAASNSTPSINGTYVITKISDYIFQITIPTPVTVAGTSATTSVQLVESGTLLINQGQQGWSMTRIREGDALVDIDFTSGGQAQYNPTILQGTSHVGLMKFVAKALLNT
jgi:hypothetical protein